MEGSQYQEMKNAVKSLKRDYMNLIRATEEAMQEDAARLRDDVERLNKEVLLVNETVNVLKCRRTCHQCSKILSKNP